MSNGFNYDTREIIFGLKSKLGRRDDTITALNERIAVLENLVQSTSDDRDGYMDRCVQLEDERDRARATAIDLEQRLAGVMRQLELHVENRRQAHQRAPGDINSMGVLTAEAALKWAEVADSPVYRDDLMEEVPF